MYVACRTYLCELLKQAGMKTKPYTSEKTLEKCQESHVCAVLFDAENYDRSGSKKRFVDQTGAAALRRKVFSRTMNFSVIIGDYTDEGVETILSKFLGLIDEGIYIDGNFVPIEIVGADWINKDDSILKAKLAVQLVVSFQGSVYRDTALTPIKSVEIDIERKENPDGNN